MNKEDQPSSPQDDDSSREVLSKYIPFWSLTDLDVTKHRFFLLLFRLFQALVLTRNQIHPDGAWQSTEVAYDIVYGGVDLPWEWWPVYAIRSTLYPYLLSIPMFVLKFLGMDSSRAILYGPFLVQFVLVSISDNFFWVIGKKTVGVSSARLGLIFYLSNFQYNQLVTRCFSNGIEAIVTIIAYYYFLQVKNKFNWSVAIMTALITVSFLIRNTSPVGWIPLLCFKVFREHSFLPFLISLFLVAIPVMGFAVALDTIYYDQGKVTLTSWNFIRINLLEKVSSYFGEDPIVWYVAVYMPHIFTVLIPFVYYGYYLYFVESRKKQQTPYIFYYCAFYLLVFSLIPHKEGRFLVSIIPFSCLMLGYAFFRKAKAYPKTLAFLVVLSLVVNAAFVGVMHAFHFKGHEIISDLQQSDPNIHSIYIMQKFDVAYYSWAHSNSGNRPMLYLGNKNPTMARRYQNYTIPVLRDYEYNTCFELLYEMKEHNFRPKYIVYQEYSLTRSIYHSQVCQLGIEESGHYELIGTYYAYLDIDFALFTLNTRPRRLYRLKEEFWHLLPALSG